MSRALTFLRAGLGPALATALVVMAVPPAAAAGRDGWQRPVAGQVVAGFHYTRARAFAAGARRGIDLAAGMGAAVRAPCSGRVTFVGAVPGWGRAVSLRCGDLVATVLRLGWVAVGRGAAVVAGRVVGAAGAAGQVRVGARRAGDRFGYVDPLRLFRGGGADRRLPLLPMRRRLGPAPRGGPAALPASRARRLMLRTPLVPARRAVPRTPPAAARRAAPRTPPVPTRRVPAARPGRPRTLPAGAAERAPLVAWLGAALFAVSLGAGGAGRVARQRRRRGARPAVARVP